MKSIFILNRKIFSHSTACEVESNFDLISLKCFSPQNIVNEFITSGETHEDDHEVDNTSSNKETELLSQIIVRKLLDGKDLNIIYF